MKKMAQPNLYLLTNTIFQRNLHLDILPYFRLYLHKDWEKSQDVSNSAAIKERKLFVVRTSVTP